MAIFEGIIQDEGINPANAVSASDGLLATTLREIGVVAACQKLHPSRLNGSYVRWVPRGPTGSIAVGSS